MKYENMIFEQSYLFFVRITFNITNQTNCLHPVFLAAQYAWPDMMLEQLSYERWKVSWFNYWLPNNSRIKFHSFNIIMTYIYTCLPNQNDVFWIGQKVRPVFFNSGQPIGSGDMCPQIKSIYFLVLLPKNWVKKA